MKLQQARVQAREEGLSQFASLQITFVFAIALSTVV